MPSVATAARSLLAHRRREYQLQATFAQALDLACTDSAAKILAKRYGVSEQYICDLRHRRRSVSDGVLERIVATPAR